MKVILTVLITIAACAIVVWALTRLVETIYNIKALRKAARCPDETKQQQGIIYNKRTHKLEADQSPITPF